MPIYFVRHGQTDWNRDQRFQSRSDVPLNATGVQQARNLRDALRKRGVVFTAAACSPLSRACETAQIILEGTGVVAVSDARLLEIELGEYEGRRESELRAEFGDDYTAWRAANFTIAAPGGEDLATAMHRVGPVMGHWGRHAQRQDVLIVAHQMINMAMKAVISGVHDRGSLATFKQGNDEVDIWDAAGRRIDCFRACP